MTDRAREDAAGTEVARLREALETVHARIANISFLPSWQADQDLIEIADFCRLALSPAIAADAREGV
jgi:hypothetical protein